MTIAPSSRSIICGRVGNPPVIGDDVVLEDLAELVVADAGKRA